MACQALALGGRSPHGAWSGQLGPGRGGRLVAREALAARERAAAAGARRRDSALAAPGGRGRRARRARIRACDDRTDHRSRTGLPPHVLRAVRRPRGVPDGAAGGRSRDDRGGDPGGGARRGRLARAGPRRPGGDPLLLRPRAGARAGVRGAGAARRPEGAGAVRAGYRAPGGGDRRGSWGGRAGGRVQSAGRGGPGRRGVRDRLHAAAGP